MDSPDLVIELGAERRDVREPESRRVVHFDQAEALKAMECTICQDLLVPPVRQCKNGHCVCTPCFASIKNCGVCRGKFISTRCRAVESFLEHVSISCGFLNDGCPDTIHAPDRQKHENACPYRPVECSLQIGLRACHKEQIGIRKYEKHLTDVHQIPCLESDGQQPFFRFGVHFYDNDIEKSTVNNWNWPLIYFKLDDQMFTVRNSIDDAKFSTWVTVVGTKEDADKYSVWMTLKATNGSMPDILWRDRPVLLPHAQGVEDVQDPDTEIVTMALEEIKEYSSRPTLNPNDNQMYDFGWCFQYKCLKKGTESLSF